jgi:hypothetical protein|tara:strand:- start:1536 stop:1766 length:231 start_codon:yes stop_codon:yes gene_type:complete
MTTIKLMGRTEDIDGFSYEILITKGRFDDPHFEQGIKLDPNAVYLNVGVVDVVNGITHDHQVFDLTDYCQRVYPPE